RGPESLAVLERLMHYGDAARCLLGNHDLNLLAITFGVRLPHRKDTLTQILQSPRLPVLIHWLRQQHLALQHNMAPQDSPQTVQKSELLMVHAGVLPAWTATKTIAFAAEVEAVLRHATEAELREFFQDMYGDTPNQWHDGLTGHARLRVIVNALTRLRFCSADGTMEFTSKDNLDAVPAGYLPWFDVPGRATADITVAFGHWSTLGWLDRPDVLALDGGCVWGGCLNALRLGETSHGIAQQHELIQVQCEQSQAPTFN
ncbi:MAG: symmetrical bis(5'-nucleosyl)-tetraphosphatase, partial [Burkholderiaceae bacterium]